MFEKFTESARAVVAEAQAIARRFGHTEVTDRHLLVALASAERPSIASLVIEELDTHHDIGAGYILEANYPHDDRASVGQIPFTPDVRRVLELSAREAFSLGHDYIGPEHILLAITRIEFDLAPLTSPQVVREAVLRKLSSMPEEEPEAPLAAAAALEFGQCRVSLTLNDGAVLVELTIPEGATLEVIMRTH